MINLRKVKAHIRNAGRWAKDNPVESTAIVVGLIVPTIVQRGGYVVRTGVGSIATSISPANQGAIAGSATHTVLQIVSGAFKAAPNKCDVWTYVNWDQWYKDHDLVYCM